MREHQCVFCKNLSLFPFLGTVCLKEAYIGGQVYWVIKNVVDIFFIEKLKIIDIMFCTVLDRCVRRSFFYCLKIQVQYIR